MAVLLAKQRLNQSNRADSIALQTTWPYPRMVAHRGAGKLAPENTLASMRLGFAYGYRMVEFDVQLSADGIAYLLHDATLDRTTNGSGPANAHSWSQLAQLDAGSWHSAAFIGEPLPTLAAVAHYCIANAIACNIEIKPTPGRERETGTAVAVEARALWHEAQLPPLLSSFAVEVLEAAASAAPELNRALLVDELPLDWLARLEKLNCVALNCNFSELTIELVRSAHRKGYRVLTYTPNDPAVVAKLISWDVDGVMTDAIDRVPPQIS